MKNANLKTKCSKSKTPPRTSFTDDQTQGGAAGVDSAPTTAIEKNISPAEELIRIPLNPAQPLAGAAASWDSLDLAVLDPAAASRVGEAQFGDLVALGVA